jgi:hypothetical protein
MGFQKAIVAAIVAGLMVFIADRGWNLDEGMINDIVQALVGGVITGLSVFYKRNRKYVEASGKPGNAPGPS